MEIHMKGFLVSLLLVIFVAALIAASWWVSSS